MSSSYQNGFVAKETKSQIIKWMVFTLPVLLVFLAVLGMGGFQVKHEVVTRELAEIGFTDIRGVKKVGVFPCSATRYDGSYRFTAEANYYGRHYSDVIICVDSDGNSAIEGKYVSQDGKNSLSSS